MTIIRSSSALIVLVLIPICVSPAVCQVMAFDPGSWEAGAMIGEPTGLSAKLWTGTDEAVDFGAAWSFKENSRFQVHVSYLFHNFYFFDVDTGMFPIYFGVGGRVRVEEDDTRVGIRIPVGVEYVFEDYPIAVFLEIAPIVDFAPETDSDLNGGLGVRYIF